MTKYILSSITGLHANNILRQIFCHTFCFLGKYCFWNYSVFICPRLQNVDLKSPMTGKVKFIIQVQGTCLKDIPSKSLILVSLSFSLPPVLSFCGEKQIWCSWTMSVRFRDFLFECHMICPKAVLFQKPLCPGRNSGNQKCQWLFMSPIEYRDAKALWCDLYRYCWLLWPLLDVWRVYFIWLSLLHTISLRKIAHWSRQ
jgi:hypothetical protein